MKSHNAMNSFEVRSSLENDIRKRPLFLSPRVEKDSSTNELWYSCPCSKWFKQKHAPLIAEANFTFTNIAGLQGKKLLSEMLGESKFSKSTEYSFSLVNSYCFHSSIDSYRPSFGVIYIMPCRDEIKLMNS